MAARDKIRERVQPFLEPGEQIQAVIPCQTGPSPYFALITYFIFFLVKYYIVVATDRNLVVFRASMWMPFKPKSLERRLPRNTVIGPVSGLWGKSEFLGEKVNINKRFHKDVEAADALAGAGGGGGGYLPSPDPAAMTAGPAVAATPAGWYPDPNGAAGQRYWDGAAWTEHTSP